MTVFRPASAVRCCCFDGVAIGASRQIWSDRALEIDTAAPKGKLPTKQPRASQDAPHSKPKHQWAFSDLSSSPQHRAGSVGQCELATNAEDRQSDEPKFCVPTTKRNGIRNTRSFDQSRPWLFLTEHIRYLHCRDSHSAACARQRNAAHTSQQLHCGISKKQFPIGSKSPLSDTRRTARVSESFPHPCLASRIGCRCHQDVPSDSRGCYFSTNHDHPSCLE